MFDCGLILEGGGMRGFYTAGVLDFFIENNYYFKDVLAVSAGSTHACSYLSGQKGRAFRINVDYVEDKRYGGMANWVKTGEFFNKEMHLNIIPNELDLYDYEAFKRCESNFYAVATNCITGKAEYLKINDMKTDIDAVWASCSLPLMARGQEFKGSFYMDGGVSDPIPVRKSVEMGNKKNVVVLTRQAGYKKEPDKMFKAIKMKYGKKYPHLVQTYAKRHEIYNETLRYIEKGEKDGTIFVIRPSVKPNVGRLEKNKEKLEQLYELGYNDAKKLNEKFLEFIL